MTEVRNLGGVHDAGFATRSAERTDPVALPGLKLVVLGLVALTAIRLAGLYFSTVDLFFDEAQYWVWSHEFAFGYFSKPPLLAWIIAASDVVCGDGEACVRAAAPVIYLGSSLPLYVLGKELYGPRVGVWAAICFALGPAMVFSTRIISTDVPLIFCWTLALLAYVKLWRGASWQWALVLGAALGVGMLAKYAMIYFLLCAAGAALVDRDARALLVRRETWLALVVALACLAPNIYWNLAHDFVTLRHTGENIHGTGFSLRPLLAAEFLGSQFAVAGPIVFATFLVALVRIKSLTREDAVMLAFALPILALVTCLSLVRAANANWAAPAVVSLTVFAVAIWLRESHRYALWLTVGLGVVVQAVLIVGDARAYRVSVPLLGERQADVYRRTLGWRELGERSAQIANSIGARIVVAESRAEVATLIYYLRNHPVDVKSWRTVITVKHHFDLTRAFTGNVAGPVLFIAGCDASNVLKRFYDDVTPLGAFQVATGPNSRRHFHAFKLTAQRQPIEPTPPCG